MQRKAKPLLAHQVTILETPWPELQGLPQDEVKQLQDDYFVATRSHKDMNSLDDYDDRDKQWKVLWHRRDRAEDRQLALGEEKEGQHTSHEAKKMELAALCRKKKSKKTHGVQPDNEPICSWPQPTAPADISPAELDYMREQCRMVKELEKQQLSAARFDRNTSTWHVNVTKEEATPLGEWFATAQEGRGRKTNWMVRVGEKWLNGYGPWKGALSAPDHNQKRVTLVGDHENGELDALREHAPGFAAVYPRQARTGLLCCGSV